MDGANSCDWLDSTEVEASVPFLCETDRVLGPGLDPAARARFAPHHATAALCNWRMRDVTYLRIPGIAFHDGELVAATHRPGFEADPDFVRERLATPHFTLHPGRVFAGTIRFSANYFHQLVEIIPAVVAYAHDPGFRDGLLLGSDEANVHYVPDALALIGVDAPQIVPLDAAVPPLDIADLTFCSLLNGCDRPSVFCTSVYDRMIAGAVAAEQPAGLPKLIYVWRADAVSRPMRNEDELVDRLSRLGVAPVLPSAMTLAQQVRLFRAARLVIGPHGAGLANVVFGTPGAVLYELLPSHYTNPCFSRLAEQRGLHYWCDVHPSHESPDLWRHATPWSVDIDAVLERVETILSAYGLG